MSYENYTETSQTYDRTRRPIGVEILLGCFATHGRSLSDLHVLDAGCGTGSYSLALLPHVGRIEGVDANAAMIQQATQKAKAGGVSPERFVVHKAQITQMPFPDAHFDAAMVNQVLHHLGDDTTNGFSRHRSLFQEFARVIRPGGVLVINISSTPQLRDGWWYRELIPDAYRRVTERHVPLSILTTLLGECGFSHCGITVPIDQVMQGDSYFESSGPLRKEWRDGDSAFALATEEELEQACARIREMKQDGTLEDYVAQRDERRRDIGQASFVHAMRVPK